MNWKILFLHITLIPFVLTGSAFGAEYECGFLEMEVTPTPKSSPSAFDVNYYTYYRNSGLIRYEGQVNQNTYYTGAQFKAWVWTGSSWVVKGGVSGGYIANDFWTGQVDGINQTPIELYPGGCSDLNNPPPCDNGDTDNDNICNACDERPDQIDYPDELLMTVWNKKTNQLDYAVISREMSQSVDIIKMYPGHNVLDPHDYTIQKKWAQSPKYIDKTCNPDAQTADECCVYPDLAKYDPNYVTPDQPPIVEIVPEYKPTDPEYQEVKEKISDILENNPVASGGEAGSGDGAGTNNDENCTDARYRCENTCADREGVVGFVCAPSGQGVSSSCLCGDENSVVQESQPVEKDTDNDGIPDSRDPDKDGDGTPNTEDSDPDGDGQEQGFGPGDSTNLKNIADNTSNIAGKLSGIQTSLDRLRQTVPGVTINTSGLEDSLDDIKNSGGGTIADGDFSEAYSPGDGEYEIGVRFTTFIDTIKTTGLFSASSSFFNGLPSGGSSAITIEAGQYGTHSVDLSDTMGTGLDVLKSIFLIVFSFLSIRAVVMKR